MWEVKKGKVRHDVDEWIGALDLKEEGGPKYFELLGYPVSFQVSSFTLTF